MKALRDKEREDGKKTLFQANVKLEGLVTTGTALWDCIETV